MRKTVFLNWLVACALVAGACGDDGGGGGGGTGGGTAGTPPAGTGGGGTAGTAGTASVEEDKINPECPQVAPLEGPNAPKGKCCYRTSNTKRIAAETGGMRTLEFRLNYFLTKNQPAMVPIEQLTIDRHNKEEQSTLFRITVPWVEGKMAAGMGTFQVGGGRYNCGEGTYSFYSNKAAPVRSNLPDPTRWEAAVVPVVVTPDAASAQMQIKPVWATNMRSRIPAYLPFLSSDGNKPLDWESSSQGFIFEMSMPFAGEAFNCIGSLNEGRWTAGGKIRVYLNIEANHKDPIMRLGGITLAQLNAFSASEETRNNKAQPAYDPTMTADRCMPGTAGCKWAKLPESLCPTDADTASKWGCHVGWAENPDKFPTSCSQEAPAGILDPDKGATSEGQCCDPLGKSTTIPACNAWASLLDFVAAAAEITDQPADQVQQACP